MSRLTASGQVLDYYCNCFCRLLSVPILSLLFKWIENIQLRLPFAHLWQCLILSLPDRSVARLIHLSAYLSDRWTSIGAPIVLKLRTFRSTIGQHFSVGLVSSRLALQRRMRSPMSIVSVTHSLLRWLIEWANSTSHLWLVSANLSKVAHLMLSKFQLYNKQAGKQ